MNQYAHWQHSSAHVPSSQEELVSVLLANRGITSPTDTSLFLDTTLDSIISTVHDLFEHETLRTIKTTIESAITANTPIIIHGDYDVDGISATAILWEYLYHTRSYANVFPFIPHRTHHGYGLSTQSVNAIRESYDGQLLIITVDCGITSKDAVTYAKSLDIDVIITDHHTLQPDAVPVDTPILHTYTLCGAGIAWALTTYLSGNAQEHATDLVALATIADIQELTGFNRILVKTGLQHLTNTPRKGLKALYQLAEITEIGVYQAGWHISPRLNASGRLDHALDGLRLICTKDTSRAHEIATKLELLNKERQKITKDGVFEATRMIEDNQWHNDQVIVVANANWHEGILGLIAGKTTERLYRPTIALSHSEGVLKGSARSVKGFNIVDAIQANSKHILQAGGHAMAAGLSLEPANLDAFRTAINAYAQQHFPDGLPEKELTVDCSLPDALLHLDTYEAIETLSPFGLGNPKPVFTSGTITVAQTKTMGSDQSHLKIIGEHTLGKVEMVGFGMGAAYSHLSEGTKISAAFTLEKNTYFATPRLQLILKDFKIQ